MIRKNTEKLKKLIDSANIEIVSFDVFDTLLFEKVDRREIIFDLVGQHYGIHGFRKLRVDGQKRADRSVYESNGYPHANINEIYAALSEHTDIPVDRNEVKEFEIALTKDAMTANPEMSEIFRYAKQQNKRVIAVADTYLTADILRGILEANGFTDFDHIYCSADEHKAKLNKEFFEHIAQAENVPYNHILHIGDSKSEDVEIPEGLKINTFLYERSVCFDEVDKAIGADIDRGLYNILYDEKKGFWYNLGIEAGGPVYMGLYLWLKDKINSSGKKLFLLSRSGYNLYEVLKKSGFGNMEYLYTSERALLLAGTVEMNDDDISEMPPYTYGQSVREILEYLCVDPSRIKNLGGAGFVSLDDIIENDDDIGKFKMLYRLDREVFLERCRYERENAVRYFEKTGFLSEDSIVFECGWDGSTQCLIDRFKKAVNCPYGNFFYYFGIRNTEKSRRQLHGKHYDTYACDFYKNYSLQYVVNEGTALFDLFFSAPHTPVFYYGENDLVMEKGNEAPYKADILAGILDYLDAGLAFAEKYNVEYTTETNVGHLKRIVLFPTEEEAKNIGDIRLADISSFQQDSEKKIAYVTSSQLKKDPDMKICWMRGLLKRPDISKSLKTKAAQDRGYQYPEPPEPEYHLEDEASLRNYQRWRFQNAAEPEYRELSYNPMFSVVVPVYNTSSDHLKEAIDSVLAQRYQNFELILVDDHSSWDNVVSVLRSYEDNDHVRVIYRSENGHISAATNDGINIAVGDYIAFMDCDDVIEPYALYEMAVKLNENPDYDFVYSDEDKITEDGKIIHNPVFKPEWSPDLFWSIMYTNHLGIYRASIVKKIGGLRSAYNGSQDYDLTLRFMEHSDNSRVGHVAKVLYHWRERRESVAFASGAKSYAYEAARYAKLSAIARRKLNADVEYIGELLQYRIVYNVTGAPLVSIIIPSKDNFKVLKQCIDSIYEYTAYKNYEIIVVDNGSNDSNFKLISEYLASKNIKYLYGKYDFNFSLMCNRGSEASHGDYLLFLNDDIEIIQRDWLSRMLGAAQQPHIGAVGAKLFYYETTTIQHSGISVHAGTLGNDFWLFDDTFPHYFGYGRIDRNCIAVTGACLMVSADIFKQVEGFDESFPIAYNDIELCFKIYEAGYYNVVRNDIVAYHHESLSRGYDEESYEKHLRLSGERQRLFRRHPKFCQFDPFLNANLQHYSSCIETKVRFDELSELDKIDVCGKIQLCIDHYFVRDKVYVSGWAFCPSRKDNDKLKCFVVFKDPYGRLYKAQAIRVQRGDVYEYFGKRKDIMNCGFSAEVDPKLICASLMPYTVGVLLTFDDGCTAFKWSDKVPTIKEMEKHPEYGKMLRLEELDLNCRNVCHCAIDKTVCTENTVEISGWGFCNGSDHYRYNTYIILKGESGDIYKISTAAKKRLDIATAFPDIHFINQVGFSCFIMRDALEGNGKYEILIRFENKFDSGDITDVKTDTVLYIRPLT